MPLVTVETVPVRVPVTESKRFLKGSVKSPIERGLAVVACNEEGEWEKRISCNL